MSNLIVMLTLNDKTVENAIECFQSCVDLPIEYWGFKNVGIPYEKMTEGAVLFTTGSNSIFSKQNIYDLAGNVAEWTLNIVFDGSTPIGGKGGDFATVTNNISNYYGNYTATTGYKEVGFRVTIY